MTVAMKRARLLTYLNAADDKKVSALYTILEEKINESETEFAFTEEQLSVLNNRRMELLNGKEVTTKKTKAIGCGIKWKD